MLEIGVLLVLAYSLPILLTGITWFIINLRGPRTGTIIILLWVPILALVITTVIAVVSLISSSSTIGWFAAISITIVSVLLLLLWFRIGHFLVIYNRLGHLAANYVDQAQLIIIEVDQSVSKLPGKVEQLFADILSNKLSTNVLQTRVEELETGIGKLKADVENHKTRLSEIQNNFYEDFDSIAQRLPGAFQDITQREIVRRLERLENWEDTKRKLKLAKWQVYIGVAAILIPYIVGLLLALLRWLGFI